MGNSATGAKSPSFSMWAKEKMIAVVNRAGIAPILPREGPLEQPSEEELFDDGCADHREGDHDHPASRAVGSDPQNRRGGAIWGPETGPRHDDADQHDERQDAAHPSTEEPEPPVFEPGPRQPIVHAQAPRAVESGSDHDRAHEPHPQHELTRQEVPRIVAVNRTRRADCICDGDGNRPDETDAGPDGRHAASLDPRALRDQRGRGEMEGPGLAVRSVDDRRPLTAVPPTPRGDLPRVGVPVGRELSCPRGHRGGC